MVWFLLTSTPLYHSTYILRCSEISRLVQDSINFVWSKRCFLPILLNVLQLTRFWMVPGCCTYICYILIRFSRKSSTNVEGCFQLYFVYLNLNSKNAIVKSHKSRCNCSLFSNAMYL